MSVKGFRHNMVMNAHHHRWANRRILDATRDMNVQFRQNNFSTVKTNQAHSQSLGEQLHREKPTHPGSNQALKDQHQHASQRIASFPGGDTHNHTDPQENTAQRATTPIHPYFENTHLPQGSIHNTLLHVAAVEELWQLRYTQKKTDVSLHELYHPTQETADRLRSSLSALQIPTVSLDSLQQQPIEEQHKLAQRLLTQLTMHIDDQNATWVSIIQGTPEPDLVEAVKYIELGKEQDLSRVNIIQQLRSYSAIHHGQISTVLHQMTGAAPNVDLFTFYPEWKEFHAKAFRWA